MRGFAFAWMGLVALAVVFAAWRGWAAEKRRSREAQARWLARSITRAP